MQRLRVRNWAKYQHYKNRRPPWIKLYGDLLMDEDLMCLQDASKWLAVGLMLLAAQTDNHIPNDAGWIARSAQCTSEPDIDALLSAGFIEVCDCEQCASKTLAGCKPNAMPKRLEVRDKRTEQKEDCPVPSAADAASPPSEPVYLWVPIKGKVPEKKNNGPVREVADGSEFGIRESLVPEWEERYPGVDVRQQLRSLQGWNKRNSGRRKTYGGFLNHVEGWLAREQNKAGSNGRSSPKPLVSAARYVVPHETDEQRALTEKAMREEVFE